MGINRNIHPHPGASSSFPTSHIHLSIPQPSHRYLYKDQLYARHCWPWGYNGEHETHGLPSQSAQQSEGTDSTQESQPKNCR